MKVKNVFTTCDRPAQQNTASGTLELPCKCLQAGCSWFSPGFPI